MNGSAVTLLYNELKSIMTSTKVQTLGAVETCARTVYICLVLLIDGLGYITVYICLVLLIDGLGYITVL